MYAEVSIPCFVFPLESHAFRPEIQPRTRRTRDMIALWIFA